jgi:ABC-type hemin transport system ATPase subunit
VLMSNGRIAADGRKEELLQAKTLGKLFGLNVELARRHGYYNIW